MLKRIREMKDQDGFTLIELMVVVLIIAILIAIAIPTFLGLRERAQNRSATSDLRNALTGAKAFYTDGDTFTGFDAAKGEEIEPSIDFAATGSLTEVGIVVAGDDVVVLTKQSASEDWFCAMDSGGISSVHGPEAAQTDLNDATKCAGAPAV